MDESTYIKNEFKKAFAGWEGRGLVLYGLSVNSNVIVKSFPNYKILGLLDGYKQSGEIYGKPILSLEKVPEAGAEAIIIVARASSVALIAKRAECFCREHEIALYDVHGKDWLNELARQVSGVCKDHPSWHMDRNVIERYIATHDVISFDIFDTLITRCVLLPEDVYALVETCTGLSGFEKERVQAEREANRRAAMRRGAATIDDIYNILRERLKLSCDEVVSLQTLELNTEKKCLAPRHETFALLKYARSLGKRVFLISDMYWSENFLLDVLKGLGFDGWEGLYLSSAHGCTKAGGLYELFRKNVPGDSYLHIGDNEEVDGIYPRLGGLDAWHLYSTRDMLSASAWQEISCNAKSISERTMLGLLATKVMENPWALSGTDGRPKISGGRDFGYVFVGPMLTAFLFWFLDRTRDCFTHLLFTARDGWLLMKMYDILRQKFPDEKWLSGTYFYTSRSAAVSAWIETVDDVRWALSLPFAGTAREMLLERFYLAEGDLLPQREGETTESYVVRHLSAILLRAQCLRENYRRYIENCGLQQGRLAMLDFVASGTCQMCLERIVGREVKGYYFVRHLDNRKEEKAKINSSSYVEEGWLYGLQSYLASNYYPLENTIIGVKPSVAYFSDDGQPVFMPEKRSKAELEFLSEVEAGCMEFFRAYIVLVGSRPQAVRSEFSDAVYSLIDSERTIIMDNIYDNAQVQDEFLHRVYTMHLS